MTDPAERTPLGHAVAPEEAPHAGPLPADRVFLRDYVAAVEIGAYAEEMGVTQRLRFNVVLEVARNAAHLEDRVAGVVNYDRLVAAIHELAEGPRITLLETFAERLAQALLADARARRVTIRIEKLDRLPGGASLGCEIVRARSPGGPGSGERVRALGGEP